MNNAEIRRQQRRSENANRPRPVTQVATIGERANNGRYNLTAADGGVSIGKAEKIYNAKHDLGDTVIAIPRRDGVILLEGPKAFVEPDTKANPLDLPALVDRCDGYLNGQIFNCGVERRILTIVWAIGTTPGFGNTKNYYLLNLVTGEDFVLGFAPPATVPPCKPLPPNFPAIPPAEPVDLEAPWYTHIWNRQSWGTPTPGSRCGDDAPVHPNNLGNYNNSRLQLRSEINGTEWQSETAAGAENGAGFIQNWNSNSISTTTQSSTPPPIDQVPFLVLGNAVVGSAVDFNSRISFAGFNWTYVSGNCPSVNYPGVPPPIDSRDPNGPPIPNVVEFTLSIGEDNGPIALIRHTPNCASPGVWNSEKSYTIVVDANGLAQYKETSGRLKTDWRYGLTFPCRDEFKSELFVNIDSVDRTKLWSIEPDDRPPTLTPNDPNVEPVQVTQKLIEPDCTATPGKTKQISPIVEGNLPFEIIAIAVKIVKR